jgi:3-dehydroquinate dehydratase-2
MHHVLVLHGPNLNALGTREPDIYGSIPLAELDHRLHDLAKELGCALETLQSAHEGVLIDALFGAVGRMDGVLLNPGGLTHTSVALRDAVVATRLPVVEVHLTNPRRRESFRHMSFVSDVAVGVIQGFGPDSYFLGLRALAGHIRHGSQT